MDRFERFMESWGLRTMAWMNSPHRLVRWVGIAHGAIAVWTMLLLMAIWWLKQWPSHFLHWLFGKKH